MNLPETLTVLSQLGVETSTLKPNSKGYLTISCPLAPWLHENGTDNRPGCSVLVGQTPSVFKCFACGECGKVSDLVDSYAELANRDDLRELSLQLLISDKPSLLSQLSQIRASLDDWVFDASSEMPRRLNPELLSYERFPVYSSSIGCKNYALEDRKFTIPAAHMFDLRYDPRQNRIVFPVLDALGSVYGAVGRTLDGNARKYWNYFGFTSGKSLGGLNHLHGFCKVIVAEGWTDIVKTHQYAWDRGFDMVCTWHADLSEHQADQLAALDATLYFGYDNDAAGHKGWKRAQDRLSKSCTIRRLTPPVNVDLGDMNEPLFESFVTPVRR